LSFAEKLLEEAEHDLSKLGLGLDTLKIQNVSDEVGYLDSSGRKQTAEIIKQARIAEANAEAASMTREAGNNQAARIADLQAEMNILEADVNRRIRDAQTAGEAMVAEEIGEVKALIAEAEEDLKVQEARVQQIQRRLEADVIAPAQADMKRQKAEAQGHAAKITEDGKATVSVLNEMITTWKMGGENARDIFLMQKLQSVMDSLVATISDVKIDRVTVLPGNTDSTAQKSVTLVEELKAGVGIDVPKLLDRMVQPAPGPAPTPDGDAS
jgi:flotillin